MAVEDLLTDPSDRAVFAALAAGVDRPRRRAVTVDPARAGRLAAAAGLDPHAVYRADHGNGAGTTDRTKDGPDNRPDNLDRYATALAHADRRVDVRRPGIDVTVSAPKSVSVLFALGDPDVAAAVRAAHQAAVGEALAYLESVAGHGLRGHQGDGQRADRIGTRRVDRGGVRAPHLPRRGPPAAHPPGGPEPAARAPTGSGPRSTPRPCYRHALTASYLYHAVLRGAADRPARRRLDHPGEGHRRDRRHPRRPDRHVLHPAAADPPGAAGGRDGPGRTRRRPRAWPPGPAKPPAEPEQTLRERWAATARAAGHHPGQVVAGRPRPRPRAGRAAAATSSPSTCSGRPG